MQDEFAPRRMGDAELALRKETQTARTNVKAALLDDLDAPKAVVELTRLCAKLRAYVLASALIFEERRRF